MVKLNDIKIGTEQIPENYLIGKRHLTDDEIAVLKKMVIEMLILLGKIFMLARKKDLLIQS